MELSRLELLARINWLESAERQMTAEIYTVGLPLQMRAAMQLWAAGVVDDIRKQRFRLIDELSVLHEKES